RRDRADDRLEGIRREGRPEAGELRHEAREHVVLGGELGERLEVELEPEELAGDRLDLRIERLDEDAARRRLDPYLPAGHDAVQTALVPQVRKIRPEGAEALGRDLEVVRLGKLKERHY